MSPPVDVEELVEEELLLVEFGHFNSHFVGHPFSSFAILYEQPSGAFGQDAVGQLEPLVELPFEPEEQVFLKQGQPFSVVVFSHTQLSPESTLQSQTGQLPVEEDELPDAFDFTITIGVKVLV